MTLNANGEITNDGRMKSRNQLVTDTCNIKNYEFENNHIDNIHYTDNDVDIGNPIAVYTSSAAIEDATLSP